MSKSVCLSCATAGLFMVLLGVCPASGEAPLAPQNAASACGAPGTGDCLVPNGSPYCENAACCEAVCAVDPYCCTTEWDEGCVSLTDDFSYECGGEPGCGEPGTGDCLVPNGSPFCENAACCEAVCAADPYCCTTEWDQVCANSTAGFPDECGTSVVLLSAVSRKTHGDAGTFDIDLPVNTYLNAGIESRAGGPTQVILTFSGPADGVDLHTYGEWVDAILVEGSQATVELNNVPNGICLVLGVLGVAGMQSETWVRIRVLGGDVNGDGVVDVLDLVQVRNQLNQSVSAANLRADVDADGVISILDLVHVRNRLNTLAICPQVDMVPIPAGAFRMGDTLNDGESSELPVHAVYADAFYMDQYEVTKELWDTVRAWGLANGYSDLIAGGGQGADHPVHSVKWYDCVKWCNARSEAEGRTPCYYTDVGLTTVYRAGELMLSVKWDANGYRLPTEAEWEKAARGGASGRRFPWSDQDTIQHARANYCSHSIFSYDTSPTRNCHPLWRMESTPYTNTSPVGFFDGSLRYKAQFNWPGSATSYQTANGANGYGLYDMAGNVWEWCNDWFDGSYYTSSPYNNPRGPTSGTARVFRGGGWSSHAYGCRVAPRYWNAPDHYGLFGGFRCAAGTGSQP